MLNCFMLAVYEGWLAKFQCCSDVVADLASLDIDDVTIEQLYVVQSAVSHWLSDTW